MCFHFRPPNYTKITHKQMEYQPSLVTRGEHYAKFHLSTQLFDNTIYFGRLIHWQENSIISLSSYNGLFRNISSVLFPSIIMWKCSITWFHHYQCLRFSSLGSFWNSMSPILYIYTLYFVIGSRFHNMMYRVPNITSMHTVFLFNNKCINNIAMSAFQIVFRFLH